MKFREAEAFIPFFLDAHDSKGMLKFFLFPAVSHVLRLVRLPVETITLAHPDEPHMQKFGRFGKNRFHGLEHDSKMRLFTTYSHTSTLRGYDERPLERRIIPG